MRMTDKSYSKRLALMWLCATIMQIGMVKASDLDSSRFIRLKEFDGYLHTTYNLTSLIPVKSRIECASLCMQNQECGSFFYLDTPQRLCQTHSVLFLTTNESTPTAGATYYQLTQERCPYESGYILYRPVPLCYRYQVLEDWVGAKQKCQDSSSQLVDVKTPAISAHLINFLLASQNIRTEHAMAGARIEADGSWYWSDGTPVTWTNWAQGEPSKGSNEKCLTLAWFYYFKWNDIPCSVGTGGFKLAYICQLNI